MFCNLEVFKFIINLILYRFMYVGWLGRLEFLCYYTLISCIVGHDLIDIEIRKRVFRSFERERV